MASSVNQRQYRVFIPGIHRDTYNLCVVKVYKPEMNLLSWELEFDGFRIEDFPDYDLFDVIDGEQAEKEVYFIEDQTYTKYGDEGSIYGRIDKLSTSDTILFNSGEYVWLENEVVLITDITDEGDYWSVTFERSLTERVTVNGENLAASFYGTKPKCYFSKDTISKIAGDDESKKWMHTYRIQRNKLNFEGLTVELQDIESGSVEYVGIIKSVSITDGTAVIECKSILTALETELSINQIQAITNTSGITLGDLIKSTYLIHRYFYRPTSTTGDYILGNFLGSFCSDIPFYIDSYKINELISKNSIFNDFIRFSSILDSGNSEEQTIKISEILNFLLFSTGSVLYQDKGTLSVVDILTPLNAMDSTVINPLELMSNLSTPKHITTRFPRFSRVNISTKDGSLIYTFPDGAGIKGDHELSIDLSTFRLTDEFKRFCFDAVMSFSRINQYILSVVKVEIPEELSNENFNVGTRFQISDIEKFDTFQKKGSEEFDNGIILNRDGDEVEIGITTQQFFNPVAPCWKVDFISYDSGTEIVLYEVSNLDEFLTTKTINGGEPTSVYDDYIYQSPDGNMSFAVTGDFPGGKVYNLFDTNWNFIGFIGSKEDITVPLYLKLVNSFAISQANLETVKYITWCGAAGYYDFAKYFFRLGVDKWI